MINKTTILSAVFMIVCNVMLFAQSQGPLIYGSLGGSELWSPSEQPVGIYAFRAEPQIAIETIKVDPNLLARGGGTEMGGKYYSINLVDGQSTLYVHDIYSWELLSATSVTNPAFDLAADPVSGKIYGLFITKQYTRELGVLDMENGTYTPITGSFPDFLVIAVDSKGQLYGIDQQGMLSKINPEAGTFQEVGTTGLMVEPYVQSATIDRTTDLMYWTTNVMEARAAVYEVDLTSAQARKVAEFPNNEQFTGLFVYPQPEQDAPGEITDLAFDFANGSLTGSIGFTVPQTTYGGEALTGQVAYRMKINDEVVEGTAMPGEKVSVERTLPNQKNVVTVFLTGANGKVGPVCSLSQWIGPDRPAAVENLSLAKNADNSLTLTWNAVTKGVNGGYVAPEEVSYTVVRMPDGQTVATELKATEFTEQVASEKLAKYWYKVTCQTSVGSSDERVSNKVLVGPSAALPLIEEFVDAEQFDLFTVIDANGDNNTWTHNPYQGVAAYTVSNYPADDWLISVPVELEADGYYKFSMKLCGNTENEEIVNVFLGQTPDVESMNVRLIENQKLQSYDYVTVEKKFVVEESGTYYLGIQAASTIDGYGIMIDRMELLRQASVKAPQAVSDVVLKAGDKGALSATIEFKTPEKSIDGNALTALDKVEVLREDGSVVFEQTSPSMGKVYSCTDNECVNGFNQYRFVATNDAGAGDTLTARVFVGFDRPLPPESIVAEEVEDGVVNLRWEAPGQGVNGGYVDKDKLTYTIRQSGWKMVQENYDKTELTEEVEMTTAQQKAVFYTVTAISAEGMSEDGVSNVLSVGKAYDLPFKESFTGGKENCGEWIMINDKGNNQWSATGDVSIEPQDNDKGVIVLYTVPYYMEEDAITRLVSPKVELDNIKNGVLSFYLYKSNSESTLNVRLFIDGKDYVDLDRISISQQEEKGWNRHEYDLSSCKGKYLQLEFFCDTDPRDENIYLDNITVRENLDYNLKLESLKLPASLKVGKAAAFEVKLQNAGNQRVSDYTLNLFGVKADEEVLLSSVNYSNILPEEITDKSIEFTPGLEHLDIESVFATVDCDNDENPANNESERYAVEIAAPTYPTVTDLKGSSANGKVQLSWTAPNLTDVTPEYIVDDMESYEAFAIDNIGDWTLVDVDKAYTMMFRTATGDFYDYPNAGEQMAFQIINVKKAGMSEADGWTTISGDQLIVCPYSMGYNDNWLISPELYPQKQTISFYAKSLNRNYGLESFEVLYSTKGTDTADFVSLAEEVDIPITWEQYSYELPEDARYFAVRTTKLSTGLIMDDISFIPKNAETPDLSIEGYRVYRNGEKLDEAPENKYEDGDVTLDVTYEYQVTVIYNVGESDYSNTVSVSAAAGSIDLSAIDRPVIVVEEGAIVVMNTGNELVKVFAANGNLLFDQACADNQRIALSPGVYVVAVGNMVQKVVVF